MSTVHYDVLIQILCPVWVEISGLVLIYLSKKGLHTAFGPIGRTLCVIAPVILLSLIYIDRSCHTPKEGPGCEASYSVTTQEGGEPDGEALQKAGYSAWETEMLQTLYNEGGPEAIHGVKYMVANGIHIAVGTTFKCSSTMWGLRCTGDWQTLGDIAGWYDHGKNAVILNPDSGYQVGNMPGSWGLATIVHEALHMEQGELVAKTKDGELEAFQVTIRVLMSLDQLDFSQLSPEFQDMYNSSSGWEYGEKVKKYQPGYWRGLQLLPPYSEPTP